MAALRRRKVGAGHQHQKARHHHGRGMHGIVDRTGAPAGTRIVPLLFWTTSKSGGRAAPAGKTLIQIHVCRSCLLCDALLPAYSATATTAKNHESPSSVLKPRATPPPDHALSELHPIIKQLRDCPVHSQDLPPSIITLQRRLRRQSITAGGSNTS